MKKLIFIFNLFLALSISSCKKDVDVVAAAAATERPVSADSANKFLGSCDRWVVTAYLVNGTDHTIDFNGTNLIFCPNNLTLTNDIMADHASWSLISSSSMLQMRISFNSDIVPNAVWKELEDVWTLTTVKPFYMVLESADRTRVITLEKISR